MTLSFAGEKIYFFQSKPFFKYGNTFLGFATLRCLENVNNMFPNGGLISHMLHLWYSTFAYIWLKFMVNESTVNIPYVEHLGMVIYRGPK